MNITPRHRRPSIALLATVGALACLALAGCGGSSSNGSAGSSTATPASSSSSSSRNAHSSAAKATFASRFARLRECLQENGVTLPTHPGAAGAGVTGPGGPTTTTPGGHHFGFGGRGRFVQGLSSGERAKYEAAIRKCGGSSFRGRGFAAGNPAVLTKFSECMRRNGVNLPKPNTSGKGPIFGTKGLDRNSSTFKNAESKCRSELGVPAGGPPGGGYPGGGYPGGGTPPPAAG